MPVSSEQFPLCMATVPSALPAVPGPGTVSAPSPTGLHDPAGMIIWQQLGVDVALWLGIWESLFIAN